MRLFRSLGLLVALGAGAGAAVAEDAEDVFGGEQVRHTLDPELEALRYAQRRAHAWAQLSKEAWALDARCRGPLGLTSSASMARAQELVALAAGLDQVEADLDKARKGPDPSALDKARKGRDQKLEELAIKEARLRSAADLDASAFASIASDPARLAACAAFQRALIAGRTRDDPDRQLEAEAEQERVEAHYADVFRKNGELDGTMGGAGAVAQPGSPDRVLVSLMSFFGAEREAHGNQAIFVLNLPSALGRSPRPSDPPWVRHLFLRVAVPFSSTAEGQAQLATVDTSSSAVEGGRFSVALGGSIIDESNPILVSHDDCYLALQRLTLPRAVLTPGTAAPDQPQRRAFYEQCRKLAARSQRLAWRVAAQFFARPEAGSAQTKLEVLAGTVVWAPSPWSIFSPFFRHVFKPAEANELGLGMSLGGNLGGDESGVDAWGRAELAVALAFSHTPDDDRVRTTVRITPRVSFRVASGALASVSLGPGLDTSRPGDSMALLASASLSYDADQITSALLNEGP